MPFTFSHPAIVLPLTYLPKRWVSSTGLIVGSLTPDFEYFIRMEIRSYYSHSISGLFWFNLPLGILIAFIFHNIVRDSLFQNLPEFLRSRFIQYSKFNWNKHFKKNWVVITVSVLIGAFSHLFWDAFTHSTGYFVEKISWLNTEWKILNNELAAYKIGQHLSTLVGGLIIILTVMYMPKNKAFTKKISFRYWVILMLLTLIIFGTRVVSGGIYLLGDLIVSGISAGMLALIFTPLLMGKSPVLLTGEEN